MVDRGPRMGPEGEYILVRKYKQLRGPRKNYIAGAPYIIVYCTVLGTCYLFYFLMGGSNLLIRFPLRYVIKGLKIYFLASGP